jgi:hypothetical protein
MKRHFIFLLLAVVLMAISGIELRAQARQKPNYSSKTRFTKYDGKIKKYSNKTQVTVNFAKVKNGKVVNYTRVYRLKRNTKTHHNTAMKVKVIRRHCAAY